VKVGDDWRYVHRAVDRRGEVIDVSISGDATLLQPAGSSPLR